MYLIKSLASTLDKAKLPAGAARPSPPPDDEDPWAGIFRDPNEVDDYWSSDEDDDEDDDEEEEEDGDDDVGYEGEDYWSGDGYGTGEDEDHYEGPYINPRWAPPTVYIAPEDYPFLDDDAEEIVMLRRGATMQMIEIFHMSYDHDTGLCALVEDGNAVYLGWNIELHPDDESGEDFMDWILTDITARRDRWRIINDDVYGTWTAWKLVPEDEDEEYDNTDSELWAEEMGEDDDL